MTFNDIYTEVLNTGGFDPTVYTSRVKSWVNTAQAQIARSVEIPDLFTSTVITTVAGTADYALPADLIRINGLIDTMNLWPLRSVDDSDYLFAADQLNLITGRPELYAIAPGAVAKLYPVPDAAYALTLTYYRRPPDLVNDTDVSQIPVDYHDLMVSFALYKAYRSEDDIQMAQFYTQEFNAGVRQLGTDRQYEVKDSPRVVPGTWNDIW